MLPVGFAAAAHHEPGLGWRRHCRFLHTMLLHERTRGSRRQAWHFLPGDWRLGLFLRSLGTPDWSERPPGLRVGVQVLPVAVHLDWVPRDWLDLLPWRVGTILRAIRREAPSGAR